LFPGFQLLDLYGPLEMRGFLGKKVATTMLAKVAGEIVSSAEPKGVADLPLAEAGALDPLLIHGGMACAPWSLNLIPSIDSSEWQLTPLSWRASAPEALCMLKPAFSMVVARLPLRSPSIG